MAGDSYHGDFCSHAAHDSPRVHGTEQILNMSSNRAERIRYIPPQVTTRISFHYRPALALWGTNSCQETDPAALLLGTFFEGHTSDTTLISTHL